MFTGIITEIGEILKIDKTKNGKSFKIKAPETITNKEIGASIAINGVCTTIIKIEENSFWCDVIQETLSVTNFNDLKEKQKVNLEPALTLNQGIDGHLVQGHVDGTGEVISLTQEAEKTILRIKYPKKLKRFLSLKGSITINGVSLTISRLETENLEVSLIPHTLEKTIFPNLKKGDRVNLEVDLIARYLSNLLESKSKETEFEFLKERGFI